MVAAAEGAEGAAMSRVPHSGQNLWLLWTGSPHEGQERGSGEPHSAQNFFPAGLKLPQPEQTMAVGSPIREFSSLAGPPYVKGAERRVGVGYSPAAQLSMLLSDENEGQARSPALAEVVWGVS